ncbi:MAG TPA: Hsp20/alpha crystallin family protein [Candidatus Saccharimonadales bacterium]|nr:Hsp20/alpha crystallin family protein [Candidatus Saccharimonadales bacterium]
MARGQKQKDDLLLDEELAAAFLNDDDAAAATDQGQPASDAAPVQAEWEETEEEVVPGQLAVDVYETKDKLVIKARTAGVDKKDLDVSISDGILTISGTLSAGDESSAENYHIQECYWGEFRRSVTLPVPVQEDGVQAELKDGVLTITFTKIKQETARKIEVL